MLPEFIEDLNRIFPNSALGKLRNWLGKINLWWNIKRILSWIPVLWNNYDFDESYLLRIMEHKFKLMEKFFDSDNAMTASAKRHAYQCRICKNLCKRLAEEDYTSPYDERNESVLSRPWKTKPIKNESGKVIAYKLLDNNTKLEGYYILLSHKHEDKMIQQDIDYLCSMIKKYLREWWD